MTMRVALYARVSTAHHEQDPMAQMEELRAYCKARGYTVVEEYIDHGISGATKARPGLDALMARVRARSIDGVVITKLDRLFRSLSGLVQTLDEMGQLGVAFISIRDSIDYTTASGRMMVHMLGAIAEFERSLIVDRVNVGLARAKAKGVKLGRKPIADDPRVHRLRANGHSYAYIAKLTGLTVDTVRRMVLKANAKSPSKANV